MTSENPEPTSPINIAETEQAFRISVSVPMTTDRTAESIQEQAVVEDLMAKQAYRIETSFMAAMDRFSSELRMLFQERMSVTSSATPPRAGQRRQERERIEPYGESSSLSGSGRTQASGYGQHSQPPTNSWGQSQPTWANPGPTYPAGTAYGPLHALAVSLGQNSPTLSAVQQLGPTHTLVVQTQPGPSNATSTTSQQHGQSSLTVAPPLQAYGSAIPTATQTHPGSHCQNDTIRQSQVATPLWPMDHTHPGQTHGAYLMPPDSVATAEPLVQVAQQVRPQNDVQ
ncbi:hypothetical protein ACE6H2_026526 [Prunus campanulata]